MLFDKNNLRFLSNVNPNELIEAIDMIPKEKPSHQGKFKNLGYAFVDAEKSHNINAIILAAIACEESRYGNNDNAEKRNNLFTLQKNGNQLYFETKEESIKEAALRLDKHYLEFNRDFDYRYAGGGKDLDSVGKIWCETPGWSDRVTNIANRIVRNIEEIRNSSNITEKNKKDNIK